MPATTAPVPARFSLGVTEAELLTAVEQWVGLLASEDYVAAYAFTEHCVCHGWTPALIQSVIYGYGFPIQPGEEPYRVTPIATAGFIADGFPEHRPRELEQDEAAWPYPNEEKPGVAVVGEIWYSLPLNGLWSDVTATFNVLRYPEFLTLELQEIHVF